MNSSPDRTRLRKLRTLLLGFSILGFLLINVPFIYFAISKNETFALEEMDPITLIFLSEAMILIVFFAVLIAQMGWRKPGWIFFVALSFLGSLAFSVPFQIYLMLGKDEES